MKREWLTMAVTGAVAVLVLSGCGDSNGKAPRQQSAPGAKAQAAAEAKAKALTGGLPTGAPAQSTQAAQPAQTAQTVQAAQAAATPVRRLPQHRTVVTNNLQQIGQTITMYSTMHDEMCPPDLAALAQENPGLNRLFLVPYDRERRNASGADNTSFVYLGKGVNSSASGSPGALPLLFEKPDLLGPNGECFVLYADGHAEQKNVRGKTCKAIAEELLAGVSGAVRETILANAAAADGAR